MRVWVINGDDIVDRERKVHHLDRDHSRPEGSEAAQSVAVEPVAFVRDSLRAFLLNRFMARKVFP